MHRSTSSRAHRGGAVVLLVAGALLLATPGHAAKLAWKTFSTLKFANLGRAEISTSGTGIATVNGSGGKGHLTTLQQATGAGVLDGIVPVTDPIVTAGGIVAVKLSSVQARPDLQGGIFRPISGAIQSATNLTQNTMPTTGAARICLFNPDCSGGIDSILGQQTTNGAFIGGGVGGVVTIGGAGGIRISIIGAPWTVNTVSVSNRTDGGGITTFSRFGWAHGPSSGTSSTATTSGVLQIVVASQTQTIGIEGNNDRSGNITFARIHFIPEPGLLILLGSGAVGLALLGRRRTRR